MSGSRFVLLTPALILILVFIAYPFVLGIWMSLTDKLVGTPGNFVGLGNYASCCRATSFDRRLEHGVLHLHGDRCSRRRSGCGCRSCSIEVSSAAGDPGAVLLPFIVPTVLSTLAGCGCSMPRSACSTG